MDRPRRRHLFVRVTTSPAGQRGELDLRESKLRLYKGTMSQIILEDFNLESAERHLCLEALTRAGNIVGAAKLLGITRHAMKRRIVKLRLDWPRPSAPRPSAVPA